MMSFSRSWWPSRSWPRGQTGGEFLRCCPTFNQSRLAGYGQGGSRDAFQGTCIWKGSS